MKKLSLLLFTAIFLISGCSGSFIAPKAPDMNKCYTMTAVISTDDAEYTATLTRTSVNCWEIVFAEPFSLSGMKIFYENGDLSASLDSDEAVPSAEIWAKSAIYSIINALESASLPDGKETVTLLDGVLQVAAIDYTLVFDNAASALTAIRCENGSISAEISDYTVTAEAFIPQVILED